jgi:RHH-type transcriptional regulator, rel operon repressor / antitoxin RelB
MSTVSVKLPEKIEKRLDHLAHETGRTKTYYIREAVIEHIEELEDIYLAERRLEKPAKKWRLEDLENNLDVDG